MKGLYECFKFQVSSVLCKGVVHIFGCHTTKIIRCKSYFRTCILIANLNEIAGKLLKKGKHIEDQIRTRVKSKSWRVLSGYRLGSVCKWAIPSSRLRENSSAIAQRTSNKVDPCHTNKNSRNIPNH